MIFNFIYLKLNFIKLNLNFFKIEIKMAMKGGVLYGKWISNLSDEELAFIKAFI